LERFYCFSYFCFDINNYTKEKKKELLDVSMADGSSYVIRTGSRVKKNTFCGAYISLTPLIQVKKNALVFSVLIEKFYVHHSFSSFIIHPSLRGIKRGMRLEFILSPKKLHSSL